MKQRGSAPATGGKLEVHSDAEIDRLEHLVDELVKLKPQEGRIKAYMQQAGIDYSPDPIEQLNSVLQALEGQPMTLTRKGGRAGGKVI